MARKETFNAQLQEVQSTRAHVGKLIRDEKGTSTALAALVESYANLCRVEMKLTSKAQPQEVTYN